MRYALCAASDQLLGMLRHWIQKAVNDAAREIDAARPDLKARIRDFAIAVKAVALDRNLSRDELSDKLCALADRALDVRPPSRRSLVRAHLMAKRGQARAMLAKMVRLPFEAQTAHPVTDALQVLRGLYARKAYTLPDRVTIRLGRAWREAIDGYDRYKALSAFEWATLFALRVALRNGSVFVDHSFAFRSQARMLIPRDEWSAKRNHYYGHLKLPQDAKEFLEPLIGHLDHGLAVLRDATVRGDVRIDTAVHLDALSAQGKDAAVEPLRRAIFASHPGGQLPEIILEIDSATRFSWLLLGREPRSRSELLLVYAAVLAHGTSLSAADISRMVPELSPAAIRQMMNRIADERKLRQAADAVLEFMLRHPISAHWGRADLASSDMMSLETTRTVWQARADPRRRTASIGMYTHVLDRWGIFYDQPIILQRTAGRRGDRRRGSAKRHEGRGTARGRHSWVHRFRNGACPGAGLRPVSAARASARPALACATAPRRAGGSRGRDRLRCAPGPHRKHLGRVRAGGSVGSKRRCTAVEALTRFGAAARAQPVYDGGVHIGRLFRTVFLIDYFTNPAFRSELQHVLNRGEAVHTVQRAIHIGKIPSELTKHHESLAAVSSSLTLLTNAVMAWIDAYATWH